MTEETTPGAVFFDGHSNRRRLVTLYFGDHLGISEADKPEPLAAWPYEAVRRADGPESVLRLACTTAPPLARLEVRDPATRAEVIQRCRALDGPGGTAPVSLWRIALASIAAGIAILGMVWFGMPLAANRIATVMPYSWEKPLGDALDPRLRALFGKTCERPAGVAALRKLVDKIESVAVLPIDPEPAVLKSSVANAFALPGGRVYVLSKLLTQANSPDELAGILAHEFGHVAHRDGLRRLIRDGGSSFLIGMMFGDVTGAGALFVAGRSILSASNSREDEAAADDFSIYVMHGLGRSTSAMGDLLHRVVAGRDEAIPSILRNHPLTPERRVKLNAAERPLTGSDLLDATEWQDLRQICD